MATMREFTFPSSDGTHSVGAVWWLPDEGAPRAVVQLVHGISEYIGRYAPFARYLTDHGFAVVGHDHLGHGRTAKGREEYGWFAERDGWKYVLKDTHTLRQLAGEAYPGLPYFILGHSMGSFVTRGYLMFYPGTVDGAILSGTGQEAGLLVGFGQKLSALLCRIKGPDHVSSFVYQLSLGNYDRAFRPNRTDSDWLSRDQASVDAFLADPLCGFQPTVGMFRDMLGGIRYIGDPVNAVRMDQYTPVLFLSGDRDPVGSMGRGVRRVEKLFREAGCRDVTVKLYPGARHEILNETNRAEVQQDLLDWLEKKLPQK